MKLSAGWTGTSTAGIAAHSQTPPCSCTTCWTLVGENSHQNPGKPQNSSFYTHILVRNQAVPRNCCVLFIFADIGTERYTFNFTIRDSPTYFINVQSWGREEYIRSLSESFRVGDCGKLDFILTTFLFACKSVVCRWLCCVLL